MPNPVKSCKDLKTSKIFHDWKKEHKKAFLSHFFFPLDENISLKGQEEIGFFDSDEEKIYVFISAGKDFVLKPADEVFKKEETVVEELDLKELKVDFDKAKDICASKITKFFPEEKKKDGFVVLQTLDQKTLWNFTFITATLKFINVKINAETGELDSKQQINLVAK